MADSSADNDVNNGEDKDAIHDLFSGSGLDTTALAAEAAQLEALVDSLEETLEINTMDHDQETELWSAASKISTSYDPSDATNASGIKLDQITQKINRTAAKSLTEEEEEQDEKSIEEDSQQKLTRDSVIQSLEREPEPEPEESEEEAEAAVNDDMSIDDSESQSDSMDSSMNSTSEASSSHSTLESVQEEGSDADDSDSDDDDQWQEALHNSTHSLSLAEISRDTDSEAPRYVADDILLEKGILKVDPASDVQAYICDWGKWRKWKTIELSSQHSSQRWDNSFQDSSLRMPERRDSDKSFVSGATSASSLADSGEISCFDWKAWKRRKDQGQRSSTSRTTSFSMSVDEDDFDPLAVLQKLDEWESMEESLKGDDDDGSGSSDEESAVSSKPKLDRAQSEHHKLRRAKLPRRAHSDHSVAVVCEDDLDGSQSWKDWQREKRKTKMQAYSNHSMSEDSFANSSESGGSWGEASFGTDWGDSFVADDADGDREATAPPRSQSERKPLNNSRTRSKLRSQSLVLKPPSQRSLHKSPMRSPMNRSVDTGDDQWKSWQKEKRRTGMLKKTLSSGSGWGPPSNDDSGGVSNQPSDGSNRKNLRKSQSEKWNKKKAADAKSNGGRREDFKRAKSLHLPKGGSMVFDWKAYRRDKRKTEMKRSKSERWVGSVSTESASGASDQNKQKGKSFRRAQSLSNVMLQSADSKSGDFDWKAFRKDKRKSMKKSSSERLKL